MSIQRTAESALYALEELYKAIELSSQQRNAMSINDSENLIQALCNLSQLINHINQTGMCGHTPIMTTNLASNQFCGKKMKAFNDPHWNNYDENILMDSTMIRPRPQPGQTYGECILYHPIRIITTCADGSNVLHESDFVRKEGQYQKDHDHSKRYLHHSHTKKNRRRMSRSYSHRSKSLSRTSRASRSRSRESRTSHRSRRTSHGQTSQSRGRSSRSSRRSSHSLRSSRSGHRQSHGRGRRSRSSRSKNRRSRSSQRRSRSRRRSSHKHQPTDRQNRQYYSHPIPSSPISTTTNPTAPLHPPNQMGPTLSNIQSSVQPPYIRSLPSPASITTTSNGPLQPPPSFAPTIPLPPPPAISSLHSPHSPLHTSVQPNYQLSPSSIIRGNNMSVHRLVSNTLNDQSSSYQQIPMSTTSTGNTTLSQQQQQQQQQQQPLPLSSTNPILNTSTQNGILSSSTSPFQTTNSTFTSRSDNCPECRAITRLLQWAPLKCYDAAGIRRGVFLAGPKSEQLLKALYASIKDSSLSFDDIEDCLCDNE